MKLHAAPRIMLAAVLCTAALIGVVVREGIARDAGQEVVLPMAAIDPRALLSGHYVIVDLRQRLEPGETCPTPREDWDWLALRPDGQIHTLAGPAPTRERALEVGPVPVEGNFTCNPPAPDGSQPGAIWLDLGFSRFHINQYDAERIERVLQEQTPSEETRVFAVASIGRDGRARLVGLIVDGERLELDWL